jgi:hypothetical protein
MKMLLSIAFFLCVSSSTSAQSDSVYFPVRLSSFDATANNNAAKLHWSTICYLQYANFQIQKSADGKNFTTIHSFTADKLRCRQPFDFSDSSLSNLGKVFYRINVGNIDGHFFSSAIRIVYLKEEGFNLVAVYPTIVHSSLNFSLSDNKDETIWAFILNESGRVLRKQRFQAVSGVTKYTLNTNDLPTRYYWLKVINESGRFKTSKFLKQ